MVKNKRKHDGDHDPHLAKKHEGEGSAWLEQNSVQINDPNGKSWLPILSFDDGGFSKRISHAFKSFDKPTVIQSICWPMLMEGRDVVGIAETGSGKTLAFGIPAIDIIRKSLKEDDSKSKKRKPKVLILSPTRELANQIHDSIVQAGQKVGCKSVAIYGGVSKADQMAAIKDGADVLVACPGRLIDLVENSSLSINDVTYACLDEADRLLDLGFEKEIRKILKLTNSNRQTVMFSATWPSSVQKLALEYLKDPVRVSIAKSDEPSANASITQIVEVIDGRDKERRLIELLNRYHKTRENKIVIFALYKAEAARLHNFIKGKGWACCCIHGDMSQYDRTQSFESFKSGSVKLLIATDVAARGLDIPNVEYVINFTFPLTTEDYIHRIGRTGRAGKTGTAHTFFTSFEKSKAGELVNILKQTNQDVPESLLKFGTAVKKKEHSAYGSFFKDIDPNVKGKKIVFE